MTDDASVPPSAVAPSAVKSSAVVPVASDVIDPDRLRAELDDVYERFRHLDQGTVASYIPELADADPTHFAISVVGVGGAAFEVGDTSVPFTIQSISKPFVFGLALGDLGRDAVLDKVGVEPSGEAFNSIEFDDATRRPYNPMVNSGAIATTGLIDGADQVERLRRVLDTFARYAGRELAVDSAVFFSERATGDRNRAIAYLMRSFGMVDADIEDTLELYFQQCSVLVDTHDLAVMGATLANGGTNPLTGEQVLAPDYVKDVLSIMLSCGMYDYSGEWSYRVGVPAKSGVSGAILAVIPGQAAVAVYSPPLDAKGNSVRGIAVFEELSKRYSLHYLESVFRGNTLGRAIHAASADPEIDP